MILPAILSTPRAAIMAAFAAFGAVVGTFAGSVPQLLDGYGLDNTDYGLGVTLMTLTTVGAMGVSGFLARHFSHRTVLLAMLPAFIVLLGLLLSGGSLLMFFVYAMLYGLVAGATDVIMNAEAGLIEMQLKRRVYTAFHGAASLAVAVFAILSSILSTRYGTTVATLAASLPVLVAMAMVFSNLDDARRPATEALPLGRLGSVFTPRLILIGVAAGLVISCEVTALYWSSPLLAAGAPQLAALAGMGAALFGLSNAIMRFAGDGLRSRFDEVTLMSVMIIAAIIGFAGLSLTSGFLANLGFFLLVGFGVSILCPCLFVWAGLETPTNRAAGLSVAMLVAGIPRIAMPWVMGAIADLYTTRLALLLAVAALAGAFIVIRRIGRQ